MYPSRSYGDVVLYLIGKERSENDHQLDKI